MSNSFDDLQKFSVEGLRIAYGNAIMKQLAAGRHNMTRETQLAVLGEIDQFLLDMLDCCEQTDIAERAIIGARDALRLTQRDHDFDSAYERLSKEGACDGPGGAEHERVRYEWILAGRPEGIEPFIRARANAFPETCSQCGSVVLVHHACEGVPDGFSDDDNARSR